MKYKTLLLISSLIITNSTLALPPGTNITIGDPIDSVDGLPPGSCSITVPYTPPSKKSVYKYKNGNLAKTVSYTTATDKVDGIVETYYETGELFEELKFNNGKLVALMVYEKNGDQSLYYDVPGKEKYTFECPVYITCHPIVVDPGLMRISNDESSSKLDRIFGGVSNARIWYKNGNIMKRVSYSGGVVHGIIETYYKTGELFEKWKFDYGKPVAMIVYKKDGAVAVKVGEIEELKPIEYDDENNN